MEEDTAPEAPRRSSITRFDSSGDLAALNATSPPAEPPTEPPPENRRATFRTRKLSREILDDELQPPPPPPASTVSALELAMAAIEIGSSPSVGGDGLSALREAPKAPRRRLQRKVSRELHEEIAAMDEACFDDARVLGTFSCHGVEPSDTPSAPADKINQDCGCVCFPLAGSAEQALLVVLDGHGSHGEKVSKTAMHALVGAIDGDAAAVAASPAAALAAGFAAAHVALQKGVEEGRMAETGDPLNSGATAIALLLRRSTLWAAAAGDCAAALAVRYASDGARAVPLSTEHKVDEPEERARIEAAGGHVRDAYADADGGARPARLYYTAESRGPGLAISRAFGDLLAARVGLTHTPQITRFELGISLAAAAGEGAGDGEDVVVACEAVEDALFVVVGSDGLWEYMELQEACDLVYPLRMERRPAMEAAALLVKTAAARWKREEGNYRDDMTATVLYLPCF